MKTLSKVVIAAVLFLELQSHSFATEPEEDADLGLTQTTSGFPQLPIELQEYIFSFLDQKDFHRASLVCQGWREVAFIVGEERTLDLSKIKLDQKDCEAVLHVPFFSLILQGCQLREQGAFILSRFTHLNGLNLERNRIGDEGAKGLAHGSLSTLTSLDLQYNSIGDEGAMAIAAGNLSALTSLYLYNNSIGEEGKAALKKITSLKELKL